MLCVIDTEQDSWSMFQGRHIDLRRHMEYGSSWGCADTVTIAFRDFGYFSGKCQPASDNSRVSHRFRQVSQ